MPLAGFAASASVIRLSERELSFPSSSPENANAGGFAEALLMLTRLPFTDAERAETVRRLLSTSRAEANGGKGKAR